MLRIAIALGLALTACRVEARQHCEGCAEPDAADVDASSDGGAQSLIDRGLIARYFIDEAASGTGPAGLIDAAASPLTLPIDYAGNASFTEIAGNRGLAWASPGGPGAAGAPIGGTKIASSLNGSFTGTIEIVAEVAAADPLSSRILHIGDDTEDGDFTLSMPSSQIMSLFGQGLSELGRWSVQGQTRRVYHAVFDSTEANPDDRVRLYLDGIRLSRVGGVGTAPGSSIAIPSGALLLIGNREPPVRSIAGVIFYAALYATALDAGEVSINAARLLANDDH